jgi:hypothetical protein
VLFGCKNLSDKASFFHIVCTAGIDELAPVKTAVVKSYDQCLSGRDIRSQGNVMNIAKAQKRLFTFVDLF